MSDPGMTKSIKQELYELCREYIDNRIQAARLAISEAQQSANQESKSSSGDKYETGRAMMQLEIEKNAAQLSESLKVKQILDNITIENHPVSVQPGSLVITDSDVFFIAISLGKVTLHNQNFLVISANSPLGIKLIGLKPGDKITFKDNAYVVNELK